MSAKTILIAHRHAAIRDRFAAALADARHTFVLADSETAVFQIFGSSTEPISLALVDLGLAHDGVTFVQALRRSAGRALPIVVFAGTVSSAGQVPALLALHIAGYVNEHSATPQILPALAPHLFPDNFNRRTSLRVALGVPVSYRVGQTIAGAVTLDVGKSGVAIRTMNPLPLGTPIQIRFRLPGTGTDIEAGGRIAWSDRKVGMGVQFEQLSTIDQATIDAFIEGQVG
jgi:CheY-like chemotaxis protein